MRKGAVLLAAVLLVCAVPLGRASAQGSGPLPLTASEVGTCDGGTLSYLIDGDYGTKHDCTPSTSWHVELDAGEGVLIGEVRVLSAFDGDCGLAVAYSADGGEWTTLYNGYWRPGFPVYTDKWTSYPVPPSRYVWLHDAAHDQGCSNPGVWEVYEVEAYEAGYLGLTVPVSGVGQYMGELATGIVGDWIELSIAISIVGIAITAVVRSVRAMGGRSSSRRGQRYGSGRSISFREPGDMS